MTTRPGPARAFQDFRSGLPQWLIALAVLALGVGATAASVFIHPVAGFAVIGGAGALLAILGSTQAALVAVIAVLYILPFAVTPVPIGGVRLSFLDVTLSLLLVIWIFRMLTNPVQFPLITSPIDGFVLVFLGLAVVALILGINSVSNEVLRFFLKTINSVLLFWTALNVIRTLGDLTLVTRAILISSGIAGFVAIGLYILPDDAANQLLNQLRVFNYPTGNVLRFIATTNVERAIGTAVDPNVLGGMLMLAIPLLFTQILSPQPVLNRRWVIVLMAAVVFAMVLSYSRGSWLGASAALIALGTLRYRKLWLLFPPIVVAILLLPQGEIVTSRLIEGATATDLATQMRLGEYRDALRTIEAYPWFGVGFGGAPEIDLYTAAASIYLVIAQQMGLIGLAAFMAVVVAFFWVVATNRVQASQPLLQSVQLGAAGAILAALVAGVLDHYFFNLDFPHTVALFWLFLGLAMVATRLGQLPAGEASGNKDA